MYFRITDGVEDIFLLFRISHYYYSLIGTLVVLIIALPISWLTGNQTHVDEELITPWMRWAIPNKDNKYTPTYSEVAMDELENLNVKS